MLFELNTNKGTRPKIWQKCEVIVYSPPLTPIITGNQCYREPTFNDILHAEDDARDIALSLKELNFKVIRFRTKFYLFSEYMYLSIPQIC